MTKISNKISYVSLLVILFGLIAIFFIVRNILILNNNIEFEATCFSYSNSKEGYIVSYYYKHNNMTYYVKEVQKDKPKLSSKKKIYCNKQDISQCILEKNKYIKSIVISIFSLFPVIFFLIFEMRKKAKKTPNVS